MMEETNYEKRLSGFIIHGFAVAHAGAAALLAQTILGDEAVLTILTVTMIISISRINGREWGVGEALSVIGVLAGTYLGTRGLVFFVKWIPGIGNAANAISTFGVTEFLGWTTYILVKENKNPKALSSKEKEDLAKQGKKLADEERESSKRLYEKMSVEDKREYQSIMKQLNNKDLPEETILYLSRRLEKIARKYVE